MALWENKAAITTFLSAPAEYDGTKYLPRALFLLTCRHDFS